ncbi:Rossmann fold domain-containing protein [Sphingomonas sp. MMS24-J45]|uniref:Rossmann fold domain-containing protein n=1 Tax=Sphingomonas sp. MMS24-J45 TaxID=3238806 RepID=UPI0038502A37
MTQAIGANVALVFPRGAADLAAVPDAVAVALLVIASDVPDLDRAMVLAAIGPLAAARAPAQRIAAIDVAPGADEADVVAAARFLAGAESSTGQALRITAR